MSTENFIRKLSLALLTPVLSDDHFKALGHILLYHSMLENAVSRFIWFLLLVPESTGQHITSDLNFSQKINILNSLYKDVFKQNQNKIDEFNILITKIRKANERRNILVHSFWGESDIKGSTTRYKRSTKKQSGLQLQSEHLTVE